MTKCTCASAALLGSEEKFRALTEITAIAICIIQDGRFQYVNRAMETISEYSCDELLSMDFMGIVHPDVKEDVQRTYQVWSTRFLTDERYELKGLTKSGIIRWIEIAGKTIDYRGRPALMLTGTDITERKQAEDALRKSEELLKLCVATAKLGIYDWDLVNDRHVWSRETYDMYGVRPGTPLSLDYVVSFIYPGDRQDDAVAASQDPSGSGQFSFEYRIIRGSDQTVRWLYMRSQVFFAGEGTDRKAVRILGVVQDITERKQAEDALRASEAKFKSLFQDACVAIFIIDTETGLIGDCNAYAEKLIGQPKTAITGQCVVRLHPPDESGQHARAFRNEVRSSRIVNFESEVIRSDGKRIPVIISATSCVLDGRLVMLAFFLDITERKRAEDELRRNQYILARSQETAHVGNWAWDVESDVITGSDEVFRLFGFPEWERQADIGRFFSLVHPDDRKTIMELVEKVLGEGVTANADYRIVLPDGTLRYMNVIADKTVRDEAGKVKTMYGIHQDITGRKLAEKALGEAKAQADLYLDIMGHDINNMNQIGMGFLELALETLPLDEAGRLLITRPLEAFTSSSRLIENLRKLQKVQAGEFRHRSVDLSQVLEKVQADYSRIPGRDLKIDYRPLAGSTVAANELLYDLFSNLVGNAIKHTPHDPVISIRLETLREDGRAWHRISIEDNGPGIPDALKPNLFTRNLRGETSAKGSGLGLYLVKTLVDDYRGRVWAEDRVPGNSSQGSRFVVMLPASDL